MFMTDVEHQHANPSFNGVWDAAVCEVGPDGSTRVVWAATAVQARLGRAFSRTQVCYLRALSSKSR